MIDLVKYNEEQKQQQNKNKKEREEKKQLILITMFNNPTKAFCAEDFSINPLQYMAMLYPYRDVGAISWFKHSNGQAYQYIKDVKKFKKMFEKEFQKNFQKTLDK